MYNKKHNEMKREAIEAIIEALEDGYSGYYCALHNEVFNTDYYIVGTYLAKEALKDYDVFEAIELVQTYEKEQFGEVYTDLSEPEKLINMVYYIIGDEVIGEMYEIDEFNDGWDNVADEETNAIIAQLDEAFARVEELFEEINAIRNGTFVPEEEMDWEEEYAEEYDADAEEELDVSIVVMENDGEVVEEPAVVELEETPNSQKFDINID